MIRGIAFILVILGLVLQFGNVSMVETFILCTIGVGLIITKKTSKSGEESK